MDTTLQELYHCHSIRAAPDEGSIFHIHELVLGLGRCSFFAFAALKEVAENHHACVKTTGAAVTPEGRPGGLPSYVIDGRYFA
jgi:hypothetical protein